MRDVIEQFDQWRQAGQALAVATVIDTWGSSPRPTGSKMIVTAGGQIAGSVSAGCVETAVIEAAQEVIATGRPQLLNYGVADDTAWEVGLACGGRIQVFVEPGTAWEATYPALKAHLQQRDSMAVVSVLAGPEELLERKRILLEETIRESAVWASDPALGDLPLEDSLRSAVIGLLESETSDILASEEGVQYFVEVYPPPAPADTRWCGAPGRVPGRDRQPGRVRYNRSRSAADFRHAGALSACQELNARLAAGSPGGDEAGPLGLRGRPDARP